MNDGMNDAMKAYFRPKIDFQITEVPVPTLNRREKLHMFWNNLKFKYLVWKYRRSQKRLRNNKND